MSDRLVFNEHSSNPLTIDSAPPLVAEDVVKQL